jgi:curved DNA-binding protein CbpA
MTRTIEKQKRLSGFEISHGICQYSSHDYYAILGIPIVPDINKIRRSYLHIAKQLHPDTYGENQPNAAKNQATKYLSKLVNPAYTFLMAEKERDEYSTILKLLAKKIIMQGQKIIPASEAAQNLLYSPTVANYERAVEAIALQQYQDLDKILERTGQLSELNLVYILYQEGYQPQEVKPVTIPTIFAAPKSTANAGRTPNKIKIAEDHISQKQWMLAIKELREYLQIDNQNSYCHSLLGLAYMHQKLDGMAKMSFQQALKLNPQEAIALANIDKIGNPQPSKATQNTATQNKVSQNSKSDQKTDKKGGFFDWLGGG